LTFSIITSRVPVFEERIDNIVGIVYAMDMLEFIFILKVEKLKEITVKEIAHMPTYFVPGNFHHQSVYCLQQSLSGPKQGDATK
jgi:Mg2+/Co2+ transporter CorB